jgi:hypothetical protein
MVTLVILITTVPSAVANDTSSARLSYASLPCRNASSNPQSPLPPCLVRSIGSNPVHPVFVHRGKVTMHPCMTMAPGPLLKSLPGKFMTSLPPLLSCHAHQSRLTSSLIVRSASRAATHMRPTSRVELDAELRASSFHTFDPQGDQQRQNRPHV